MPRRSPQRADDLRRALAQEAARLMAQQGIADFLQAKRKAAERLGVDDVAVLPRNTEIETALRDYQRLFGGAAHDEILKEQRQAALHAMQLLGEFQPRLVGPVLSGTATGHGEITLHVFADSAESVAMKLMDSGVPHDVHERRVRMDAERTLNVPMLRFRALDWSVDATVFPVDGIRQAPYSPVDGKPMKRADLREVQELIGITRT